MAAALGPALPPWGKALPDGQDPPPKTPLTLHFTSDPQDLEAF